MANVPGSRLILTRKKKGRAQRARGSARHRDIRNRELIAISSPLPRVPGTVSGVSRRIFVVARVNRDCLRVGIRNHSDFRCCLRLAKDTGVETRHRHVDFDTLTFTYVYTRESIVRSFVRQRIARITTHWRLRAQT